MDQVLTDSGWTLPRSKLPQVKLEFVKQMSPPLRGTQSWSHNSSKHNNLLEFVVEIKWIMTLLRMPHYSITVGNDITRHIHCDITMDNDIAMCTYHGITMHNDVAMNLFAMYYYAKL